MMARPTDIAVCIGILAMLAIWRIALELARRRGGR
jgi:hypothetical protein